MQNTSLALWNCSLERCTPPCNSEPLRKTHQGCQEYLSSQIPESIRGRQAKDPRWYHCFWLRKLGKQRKLALRYTLITVLVTWALEYWQRRAAHHQPLTPLLSICSYLFLHQNTARKLSTRRVEEKGAPAVELGSSYSGAKLLVQHSRGTQTWVTKTSDRAKPRTA